jgi:hypothetical protein
MALKRPLIFAARKRQWPQGAAIARGLERLVGNFLRYVLDGFLVGDSEAVTLERDQFAGMVGKHANVGQAEIDQNLRPDSALVLQHALPRGIAIELSSPVIQHARHFCGSRAPDTQWLLLDGESSAGLM